MMQTATAQVRRIGQVELEVFETGPTTGDPLLILHDVDYVNGLNYPYITSLARTWRVTAPSHPGFGGSSLPDGFDSVDDLAYLYLDLLEQIGPAHVLGFGFGGWIAAEVAIRCVHRIKSLVLVDALGIKVGDRTTRDIVDTFVVSPSELVSLTWHDAERGQREMPLPVADRGFSEDDLAVLLGNRRSAALFGWKPFMHSPKLYERLKRIDCPTLVVWGSSDRVVTPEYGRAYSASIPGARFERIEQAGHYPYLEQPDQFAAVLESFLKAEHHL
jgi:pimeloyl-ACP methyl ester carboxylesterase